MICWKYCFMKCKSTKCAMKLCIYAIKYGVYAMPDIAVKRLADYGGPQWTLIERRNRRRICMFMYGLIWEKIFISFLLLISVWRRFPRPSPAMEGSGERYAFRCRRGKTVPAMRTGHFWKLLWRTAGRVCKRKPPDAFARWLDWQDGRGRCVDSNLSADRELSKNRSMAGDLWGAVYDGRHYAVDQEEMLRGLVFA